MKIEKREDEAIYEIERLFRQRGYTKFKPSWCEDFSLYKDGRDYSVSKNAVTFSSMHGKLMALRSDVTLSAVSRRTPLNATEKLYYNEKVFRQESVGGDFTEITQTGAEIIGAVDGACEIEITSLICDTLATISEDYILEISDIGFTEGLLEEFACEREKISECLRHKDLHDFYAIARENDFSDEKIRAFEIAVRASNTAKQALAAAEKAVLNDKMAAAVKRLYALTYCLERYGYGDKIRVDYSIDNRADYYTGLVFNGYINGVAKCVLSGGRYDKLLKKFGKKGGAIGFALYLGELERLFKKDEEITDYKIIYDDKMAQFALDKSFELRKCGKSVRLCRSESEGGRALQIINMTKDGADNA